MRFNLIRVGGWRFLSSVLKFHCFLQVIRINVDGSFISLSGREFVSLYFTDWETWASLLKSWQELQTNIKMKQ